MGSAAPYLLVSLTLTAVIHGGIAIYGWRRRGASGALLFGLLNLALAIWLMSYAGELAGATFDDKVIWAQAQYIGIVSVPVLWFLYALELRGRLRIITRGRMILLWIVPVLTLIMVMTTRWHGLHWKTIELTSSEQLSFLRVTYGL